MGRSASASSGARKRRPPALTPEAQEDRMISLAIQQAEKQLEEGTASAQVVTFYLKLASSRDRLEREKLRNENELLKAKTKAIQSMDKLEELYTNAISAMKSYNGTASTEDDDDE